MTEIKAKEIKLINPSELVPNPRNANIHPEKQLEVLEKIIKVNGFREPITVSNRSGMIVCGHARLVVAKRLNMSEVPVVYQDFESEVDEVRHLVAENEIARYAEFSQSDFLGNLESLDIDIKTLDMEEFGLIDFELSEIELIDSDEQRELNETEKQNINNAWSQWSGEMIDVINLLKQKKVFCQSLTPSAMKIYFLNSLYFKKKFPRSATTARQYHRMFCSGDGKTGSIVDFLKKLKDDSKKAPRVMFSLQEKPSIEKLLTVSGVPIAGHKAPLDFPAELARDLINEFSNNGQVLDPCHGWGGRLVGFLLSDAKGYFGIDASPETNNALNLIFQDLKMYVPDKQYRSLCSPFEDAEINENFYNMAITSPPYFDREVYTGGEQAHTRYKSYDSFIDGFYTQLIKKTHNALLNNGVFILQVGNQKYDLDKKALSIAKTVGFKHLETRQSGMKKVGATNNDESNEVILIFRKDL